MKALLKGTAASGALARTAECLRKVRRFMNRVAVDLCDVDGVVGVAGIYRKGSGGQVIDIDCVI